MVNFRYIFHLNIFLFRVSFCHNEEKTILNLRKQTVLTLKKRAYRKLDFILTAIKEISKKNFHSYKLNVDK